jgi:hypothetical protein
MSFPDEQSANTQDPTTTPLEEPALVQEAFQQNFQTLLPLILAEWPQLSQAKLLEAEGNLEHAVTTIADHTDHTRTLVRRQLSELATLATQKTDQIKSSKTYAKVDELVHDLEARTEDLMKEFKAEVLPELESQARSNLGTSLLITLGLGFILGLLFGGRRG